MYIYNIMHFLIWCVNMPGIFCSIQKRIPNHGFPFARHWDCAPHHILVIDSTLAPICITLNPLIPRATLQCFGGSLQVTFGITGVGFHSHTMAGKWIYSNKFLCFVPANLKHSLRVLPWRLPTVHPCKIPDYCSDTLTFWWELDRVPLNCFIA